MIRGVTKTEGSITVFHPKDNLDTVHVKAFVKKIHELLDSGRLYLVLDLAEVEEICLLGMVSISTIFNKCRQMGGALKIASLTDEVHDAFLETNLINTVDVYDGVLDAIKSFRHENLLKAKTLSGSYFVQEKNSFVAWDRLPAGHFYH